MKRLLVTVLLGAFCLPGFAQVPFHGMKDRIPADANSLILINADKVFGSKVADRERWDARRQAAYEAGLLALPPDATEVIIAGRTDFEISESIWELGLIRLSQKGDITEPVARYGGELDNISGRPAARLPDDSFLLQFNDTFFGAYTPANRQDVTRWLRSTDRSNPDRLSPYFKRAFDYATKVGSPIIMALDLDGVLSEAYVKTRLKTFESFVQSKINPDVAAKIIGGVKGVTLGVTIGDEQIGAIRVDFEEAPGPLAEVGKPMLLEILRRSGAMVDDFANWEPSISGTTFLLRGKLTTDGTRRILSVLELPRSLAESMEDQSPGDAQNQKLLKSQMYFKQLTALMDDLREKPKRDGVKTFGQAAAWYDRYARKIDKMPILNVDEALLDFGATVADSFRNAEALMKGVGMRSKMRTQSNNVASGGFYTTGGGYRAGMGYHGGLYGSAGYSVSMGPVQASVLEKGRSDSIIRSQERTKGAASVQQIWQQLDSATADMRRSMTEKYGVEF